MNQKEKATILLVTHDPYTASYCDRILFIKDGVIFLKLSEEGQEESSLRK